MECYTKKGDTFTIRWSDFKMIEIIEELYTFKKKLYLKVAMRFHRGQVQRLLSLDNIRKEKIMDIINS